MYVQVDLPGRTFYATVLNFSSFDIFVCFINPPRSREVNERQYCISWFDSFDLLFLLDKNLLNNIAYETKNEKCHNNL